MGDSTKEKQLAAQEAVKLVEDGMTLGLGTGSTAYFAIEEIGQKVRNGFSLKAVPTSARTEEQARGLGIELVSIDDVDSIDLTIDGTDEFDDDLNLIKGGGGALLKEKMVARITDRQVIIADSTKHVERLGAFKIPVEVLPFTVNYVKSMIDESGGIGHIRMNGDDFYLTDEKNYIVDADYGLMEDPYEISDFLNDIEGVVCNGLFLDLAEIVIIGKDDSVVTYEREADDEEPDEEEGTEERLFA
ncbi:MAG: ribose-5-phosphate isomerase RpiA [Acidobacteria bacterium]|nr:MAG: ribose-5-phosphate isomerase RpiA [Acidobacteriota bacterium]REJ98296.1 MAG: ribose-5-phosphate isomerase RpiA [Acidobacteriota bacterium]REK17040.1 MAG: ribose-5-phosphate isomerase RpiA [Acidobacteriota bacterium]REK42950.1 MAG: ribose-5-phosphate isomerase RpiA [Acidobacteriota bacterium]